MSLKTRGIITLVCGIASIIAAALILVLLFIFGPEVVPNQNIIICPIWILLGIYFCYKGRKMIKGTDE